MNQSYGLSFDETLFLSYQKVLKVKIVFLDWFQEW